MDDSSYNPPTVSQAFGASDRTQPSTWSSKPSESYRPKPSAKIRGLIGRLGLRYQPTSTADLPAFQAMLAMLGEDVADIPPDVLERAIDKHVMTSPYMPKAAELRNLAQGLTKPKTTLEAYAEDLNAMSFSKALGWHWCVSSGPDGRKFLDRKDGFSIAKG